MIQGLWKLLSGGFISDVGEAIDRNITSTEEKLQLKNELEVIFNKRQELVNEAEKTVQENLTRRHEADMQSDSKLAKNVRPGILISITVVYIIYLAIGIFIDMEIGSSRQIAYDSGRENLTALLLLTYGYYFSSRGLEKAVKVFSQNKYQKPKKQDDNSEIGW